MEFTEDLLHYVWKSRLLHSQILHTTAGEPLSIVNTGMANAHSGPDFENAKLIVNHIHWAGNVEMHIHSSDWYKHHHETDTAYDNVILHVVYLHDQPVFRKDGTEIPVLELKNLIPKQLLSTYRDLISSAAFIPCASALPEIDSFFVRSFISRVLVERLEQKSEEVISLVKEQKGNWDDTFYITIARNFGFKHNALPFELVAKSLPQTLLAKHKNKPLQTEALLFGQSGLLETDFVDEYPARLKKEYDFLRKKYHLNALDASLWKFMRLRPANFPTIRLAQFAALVLKSNHLFAKILDIKDLKALRNLFSALPVNIYWQNHFQFDKAGGEHSIQPGAFSLDNILINSVAVFLYAYGRHFDREEYRDRAIKLLEQIPPEKNQILTKFKIAGIKAEHSGESQGLLQLKRTYCDRKKCLSCGIGTQILSPS